MTHIQSEDHSYFSIVPNIILELGLDPYQKAVYLELRRIAGEKGKCTMSNKNICSRLGMSDRKFRYVKHELSLPFEKLNGKSLIRIESRQTELGDKDTDLITIVDIWKENIEFFQSRNHDKRHDMPGGGAQYAEGVRHDIPDGPAQGAYKEEPLKEDPYKKKKYTPNPSKEGDARASLQESTTYGKFVKLTEKEMTDLKAQFSPEAIFEMIDQINDYLSSTGNKPYKDYAATIRNWIRRKKDSPKSNSAPSSEAEVICKKIQDSLSDKIRKGEIVIGYNYIEFNLGMHCDKIGFSENALKERCKNNLRKMGIIDLI